MGTARRAPASPRRRWAALAVWALGGCVPAEPPPEPADPSASPDGAPRPNVVLISIDSLRADHLFAERDGHAVTPRIRELARRGVSFPHAQSQSGWTLPAMLAMTTGRWPPLITVDAERHLAGADPDARTVAEIFGLYGYDTAAVWGSTLPSEFPAVSRGFATVLEDQQGRRPPRNYAIEPVEWLATAREPYFLLVHNVDLHAPSPAAPIAQIHVDRAPAARCDAANLDRVWEEVRPQLDEEAARDHVREHYLGALAFFDTAVGRIVAAIETAGQADRTVVVLTSDHGEDLWDHGELGHGKLHYDSVLEVPLLVVDPRVPAAAGRVDTETVPQTIDLAPTLLALAGIPVDQGMDGRSLTPVLSATPTPLPPRPVFSLTGPFAASLRDPPWALLLQVTPGTELLPNPHPLPPMDPAVRPSLFDLATDPGEHHDLLAERPEVAAPLQARLLAWVDDRAAAAAGAPAPTPPDATVKALRARGYWEAITAPAASPTPPSPP